jgi:hypothetical protein
VNNPESRFCHQRCIVFLGNLASLCVGFFGLSFEDFITCNFYGLFNYLDELQKMFVVIAPEGRAARRSGCGSGAASRGVARR